MGPVGPWRTCWATMRCPGDVCGKRDQFRKSYDHPEAQRTSTMVDRLRHNWLQVLLTRLSS